MKKIFLLLTIFSMVFASCDPLEDINAEIDAIPSPIVGEVSFTLTDEDYDDLEQSRGRFNSLEDARTALPDFLSKKYPVWGLGSSATVEFNLDIGRAFNLNGYDLVQTDYTASGSDLLGFESTATPADFLTDIISSNFTSPEEGNYVAASYFQYTGSAFTVTPKVSLKDNLDYGATAGDLTTVTTDWVAHSGSTVVGYATTSLTLAEYPSSDVGGSMTIGAGSQDVNTAITPIIEEKAIYASALMSLSEVGDGTYFFHLMEEDGSFNFSARVGAKTDGAGGVLFGIGASSSSLTYGTTVFSLNTTYLVVSSYTVETGVSNLYVLTSVQDTEPTTPEATNTGIAGNSANRIGIRQGGGGPTGTIDGIRAANTWSALMSDAVLPLETIGDKEASKAVYIYAGDAWTIPSSDTFYSVTEADFATMGIESFGSSTSADDYLPAFLNLKFPFAQEEKTLEVAYNYVSSSSGAQTRGNSYSKTDGAWVAYQSTISTSQQFGQDGTTWVPDNTIRYTLVAADYTLVSSTLLTETGYESAAANLNSFGNFNRTGDAEGTEPSGTSNWNDLMMTRALGIILDKLNPSATEDQKYLITVTAYDGSTGEKTFRVIKKGGVWVSN